MLLLLLLLLPNKNKVSLEFDESIKDFNEFEKIFKALRGVDNICQRFSAHYKSQDVNKIRVKSEVRYLTKKSPFELTAFVADNWFEIFLFIISSYDRIRPNTELIFKDAKSIANTFEESFKDVTKDFPKLEKEILEEILKWFNDLPLVERAKIVRMMIRQNRIFKKIKKISFDKNSFN